MQEFDLSNDGTDTLSDKQAGEYGYRGHSFSGKLMSMALSLLVL